MKKYILITLICTINLHGMEEKTPNEMFLGEIKDLIKDFKKQIKRDFSLLSDLWQEFDDVNLNTRDKNGNTALHYAARCNDATLAQWLLEWKETDANACNNHGSTPLILAAYYVMHNEDYDDEEFDNTALNEILDDDDTDTQIKNNKGKKAIDYIDQIKYPNTFNALKAKTEKE